MKDKLKNKVAEARAETSQKQESRIPKAPANLVLIVTIVNRNKADFYMDFMQSFEINMQTAVGAHGTEITDAGKYSGSAYTEKAVLIGVAREDRKKDVLEVCRISSIPFAAGAELRIPCRLQALSELRFTDF